MENFKHNSINFENEVINDETQLNSKIDKSDKYHNQIPHHSAKMRPNLSLRIRKFFIRKRTKRMMEFGAHPRGIHWMSHAIFHSENGCINCKMDLEKED